MDLSNNYKNEYLGSEPATRPPLLSLRGLIASVSPHSSFRSAVPCCSIIIWVFESIYLFRIKWTTKLSQIKAKQIDYQYRRSRRKDFKLSPATVHRLAGQGRRKMFHSYAFPIHPDITSSSCRILKYRRLCPLPLPLPLISPTNIFGSLR